MAKIRTRRRSLIKARDPLLEIRERAGKARDVGREWRELAAPHEHLALVDNVVGERFPRAQNSVSLPACERARGVANTLPRDVADDARKRAFDLRPQIARQVTKFLDERPGAADARERDH